MKEQKIQVRIRGEYHGEATGLVRIKNTISGTMFHVLLAPNGDSQIVQVFCAGDEWEIIDLNDKDGKPMPKKCKHCGNVLK